MRTEFASVAAGFALLPPVSGNANKAVIVNPGGTALTTTTGTLALGGNFSSQGAVSLAGGFSTTGAFNLALALSASVTLTMPQVNGTIATLAGTETLFNKTLFQPALGTPASGVLTNCTGTASGLTAGHATTATNLSGGSVSATTLTASGNVSLAGGALTTLGGNVIVSALTAVGGITLTGDLFGFTSVITGLTFNVGFDQVVGARSTGWTAGTGGTPNKGAINYATATLTQLANRVMALEQALFATSGHGLIGG